MREISEVKKSSIFLIFLLFATTGLMIPFIWGAPLKAITPLWHDGNERFNVFLYLGFFLSHL